MDINTYSFSGSFVSLTGSLCFNQLIKPFKYILEEFMVCLIPQYTLPVLNLDG